NSPPAAVSWAPGRLDIFGLGPDNQMFHKFFDGTWSKDWEPLGGRFNRPPAAVSWAPGRLDISGFGTDHQMFHLFVDGTLSKDWEPLGGIFNLPGQPPQSRRWQSEATFSDSTPLGGRFELVANHTGAFGFSGHMHDSGFDPIGFSIISAIVTQSGKAYGFGFS